MVINIIGDKRGMCPIGVNNLWSYDFDACYCDNVVDIKLFIIILTATFSLEIYSGCCLADVALLYVCNRIFSSFVI